MNDVQNIVYLYFLHHAPFRETLHGSIYANNKRRNNSVTALNILRICAAYAPKPTGKTVGWQRECRHVLKHNSRTLTVVTQHATVYLTENYEYPITVRNHVQRNIHIRNARSTILAPLHIVCIVRRVCHFREHIIFIFVVCIIYIN